MGPEGRQIDRNGTPSLPPRCASNQHFMYPVRTLCCNATSTTQRHQDNMRRRPLRATAMQLGHGPLGVAVAIGA